MSRKVEFKDDSNLGQGKFIAVEVDKRRVGYIQKNRNGEWCYFSGHNVLNPEIVTSDLEATKKAVTARYSR
jgi:hypothetical protein